MTNHHVHHNTNKRRNSLNSFDSSSSSDHLIKKRSPSSSINKVPPVQLKMPLTLIPPDLIKTEGDILRERQDIENEEWARNNQSRVLSPHSVRDEHGNKHMVHWHQQKPQYYSPYSYTPPGEFDNLVGKGLYFSGYKKSTKRKSTKRKSTKRKSTKRKSTKRKSTKRKSKSRR